MSPQLGAAKAELLSLSLLGLLIPASTSKTPKPVNVLSIKLGSAVTNEPITINGKAAIIFAPCTRLQIPRNTRISPISSPISPSMNPPTEQYMLFASVSLTTPVDSFATSAQTGPHTKKAAIAESPSQRVQYFMPLI